MKNKIILSFSFTILIIFFSLNINSQQQPLGEIIAIMGTKCFISAGEDKNLNIGDELQVVRNEVNKAVIKITKVSKTTSEAVIHEGEVKLADKVFLKTKAEINAEVKIDNKINTSEEIYIAVVGDIGTSLQPALFYI